MVNPDFCCSLKFSNKKTFHFHFKAENGCCREKKQSVCHSNTNSSLKYISKADTSVFTFGSYFAVIHSQNDLIATYVYKKP